jgi:hypothetical protein
MDRQSRRANKEPTQSVRQEHNQSVRQEPTQSVRREPIQSLRREPPQVMSAKRNVNPAYNPFIHASNQPQRMDALDSWDSTNPSALNWEQRSSAEKAEVRRAAPKKNAPIPSDGDETNTDGETNLMFKDKLTPADKNQITRLQTAIRRIKSKTYDSGYLKDKERAINAAEFERAAIRTHRSELFSRGCIPMET